MNDLCEFYKGNGISKDDLSNEGCNCILYGQLYTTYLNEVITKVVSKTSIKLANPFYSKINDLIIPSSGEDPIDIAVARSIQVENVLLGGDLNILRPKNDINSSFLSYQLNGKRKLDIAKIAQGKSIVHLHNSDLKNIRIYYPSIEEQSKIATLLLKIDKRIETQSKIIDDYSLLKNSISSSLFINMDVKTKLSDICIINKGQQINGSDLHENGLYYMMNGGISPSGYLNMYNKNENTISISEGGNSCGYVQFNTTKFWSGGHCYTIENLNPIINNKFLYYYLKFSESKIMNLRIGTGLPNIQKRDLEHFKVPIPNIEIQSFIINVLDCINSKINAEKQLLNLYQFQKSYLLKNMFV